MTEFTDTPELPPPPVAQPIPWERPGAGLGDLFGTIKLVVTNPSEAFGRLPATNAVGRALVFGLVVYVCANAVALMWNLLLSSSMQSMLERMGGAAFQNMEAQQRISPGFIFVLELAALPFVFVLAALISSGIFHGMLLMLGGAPGGYTTSLRTYCYAATAAIASLIPCAGGIIAAVWMIVLLIIGLKSAHRIPTGRAAAAVLIPFALCCVCVFVLTFLFSAAIMRALGGVGQ